MKKFITILLAGILSFNASANEELECLSQAIYHEARGEPLAGRIAVGWVVLNRVTSGRYPSSICEVVYQAKQFSWTDWMPSVNNATTYALTKQLARAIIQGAHTDPTNGAIYFNSLGLRPTPKSILTLRIQNHYFYK